MVVVGGCIGQRPILLLLRWDWDEIELRASQSLSIQRYFGSVIHLPLTVCTRMHYSNVEHGGEVRLVKWGWWDRYELVSSSLTASQSHITRTTTGQTAFFKQQVSSQFSVDALIAWDWRSFSQRRPWREGQIRWCEKCEMMVSRVIMMDTPVNIHFNASAKLLTFFPLSALSFTTYFYPTLPLADFIALPGQPGLVAITECVCLVGWQTEGSF